MPIVTGPDGSTFNFPDSTPPAEIQSALAQHYGPAAPPKTTNAIAGEPDLGSNAANSALAAGLHFVHQLPVIGDAALTGARLLANSTNGEGGDWTQANNDVHTMLDSAQQGHPVTSTLGGVAGGVTGALAGGEVLKGAQALPVIGRAAQATRAALALRSGQTTLNAGRMAVAGAAGGALQGGGEQAVGLHSPGQIMAGTASGAAMGAAGGLLGGAVAPAVGRLVGAMRPLESKTATALAKIYKESPADLQTAWRQHIDITGRAPSMAELSDYKQRGAITGLANDSATIADRLNQQAADAAAQRSANMQATFETDAGGRPTSAAPGDFTNARTAQGNVDYPASRAAPDFTVSTKEDPALGGVSPADHIAAEILPQAGLGKADRVRIMADLQNGTLSGQDAQMLRSGLSESLNRSYSPATAGYLKDFDSFLSAPGNEAPNAALNTARSNFAANSQRVEGAQHGASILAGSTPADYTATANATGITSPGTGMAPAGVGHNGGPAINPQFATGMSAGANDALSAGAATPQGATSLARRLATDTGLLDKLTTTFGPDRAAALQRLGDAETRSATALTPRAPSPDAEKNTAKDVAQAFAAVATHGWGWKAYHVAQFVTGKSMSPAVQEKVAEYLSNPRMVQQGINIMQKAGATTTQLRRMALAGAAASGIGSGDAASNYVTPPQAVTIEDVRPATAAELAGQQ